MGDPSLEAWRRNSTLLRANARLAEKMLGILRECEYLPNAKQQAELDRIETAIDENSALRNELKSL